MIQDIILISKIDEEYLSKLEKDIEKSFNSLQMFRSRFLMENSVLAMQPTIDGKYWQALLERDVHFREFLRLKYDFNEKIIDIEITEVLINKKKNIVIRTKDKDDKKIIELEIKKLEIQNEKNEMLLTYMKKEAEQRMREITEWTDIINNLRPQLKYSSDNPEECQAELWSEKYAQQIGMLQNPIVFNQNDISGTMNILTVANTLFKNEKVKQLIENEQKKLMR